MSDLSFDWIVEGLLIFVSCLLGIVLNILLILIFCSYQLKQKTFQRLMMSLALSDLLYLASSAWVFSCPLLWPDISTTHMFAYSVTFMLPLAHTGLTGSIMLTCGMSLERYITVCHPFFKIAHKWPAWYYLLPIGTISFLYTLPRYFELRVLQINYQLENSTLEDSNITLYSLQPTKLRLNENYVNLYIMWSNLIVLGILPYTILLFLNISIFKTIKKMQNDDDLGVLGFNPGIRSQRRKEVNLSKISILIVIVFMVCHSLKWLPTVWEITQKGKALSDYEWPDWIAKISSMSNFLTTLNGSFTALVYFIKQRRFITEHTFVKYIFRSQGNSLERIEELEGSRRNTVFTHLSNSRNVLPLLDQENGDATTEL